MDRAYSVLDIKGIDEEKRVIRGIATTPTPDRMGDVVEPLGVKFINPLPLLHHHRSDRPVGFVTFDKPTKKGIGFEARMARVDEPGELKDRVDLAWQEVKAGLVKAVSIGFRMIEYAFLEGGGIHFLETEVMELSLVTIPANSEATIQVIRTADLDSLAASGRERVGKASPSPASRLPSTKVVKAKEPDIMKKTIAQQISDFESVRKTKNDLLTAIMEKSGEDGQTLDAQQKEEYDGLMSEIAEVDDHLKRLRDYEQRQVAAAVPVAVPAATDPGVAVAARSGIVVKPKSVAPGIPFTRYVLAVTRAKGNIMQALEIAKANEQWRAETPDVIDVLKSAVAVGTTTDSVWAGPLVNYQNLTSEFIEFLRPLTIIGRIPGLRNVPFKVKIPRQTGGAAVNWVGEARAKPLTSLAFDSISLDFAKIAGIVPLSEELVRFSSPSAEALVRDDLAKAIVQFMDLEFIDPTNPATDVSPASITYGVTPVPASGTTAAALRADMANLIAGFLDSNMSIASGVWITTQTTAMRIGLMQNSLGQPEFPSVNLAGGTLQGLPVIASENVPASGGSPSDGFPIILAAASDILLADDGQVTIDASREASLQMESSPDSPPTAATTMVSLWQHNMVAIKAERYINWAKRRPDAVAYISGAKYTG